MTAILAHLDIKLILLFLNAKTVLLQLASISNFRFSSLTFQFESRVIESHVSGLTSLSRFQSLARFAKSVLKGAFQTARPFSHFRFFPTTSQTFNYADALKRFLKIEMGQLEQHQ
jgi:hypothetical protein